MTTFWTRISLAGLIHGLILLNIATDGYAQDPARCTKNGWDNFSEGRSGDVCQIAQKLMDDCTNRDSITIPPSSSWYGAWKFTDLPDCTCTMTMYNMLTVCAACQQFDNSDISPPPFPSVHNYTGTACGGEFFENQTLQEGPSAGHGVHWPELTPPWAHNLTDGTFNLEKANAIVEASNPNSTISTSSEIAPTETASPAASTSSSSSGPNIGAIVGGVVGGLVFFGAIIALLFFLRHRKRRARDVAPSDEFLKPEYYATPPLLSATNERTGSEYRDDVAEEILTPAISQRLSWAGGLVATRRTENDEVGDMLPPFTQGTYIGPSPHEKGAPERRRTDESDGTMRTTTTNTFLLPSPTHPGTSGHT